MILEAIMKADYEKSVEQYDKEVVEDNGIVFLGDSIIKYYHCKEFLNNDNIINRGIPGDTTLGVLNRLDEIIKNKPRLVIIHIGSNDIVRTTDDVDTIVKRILENKFILESKIDNVKVYIISILPVLRDHEITSKSYMKHRNNDIIDEINDELQLFTNIVDISSHLKDNDNNLKLEYTVDGLHLTKSGYEVFTDVLKDEIDELN